MAKVVNQPVRLDRRTARNCELELVHGIVKCLDTSVSRAVARAIKDGRHAELVSTSIDPSDYTNPDVFHRDWLAVNILKKYPVLDLGIDTEAVAIQAFHEAELVCRDYNRLLSTYLRNSAFNGVPAEVLIHNIRRKIEKCIGDAPNLNDMAKFASFSSGASTQYRRTQGDAYYKLRGRCHVTRQAALAGLCLITSDPLWSRELRRQYGCNPFDWVEIVPGSRITTVEKNAKTKRTIAIEPELNMLMQKGVGKLIRNALKRVGIDLNSQEANQVFAWIGSLYGSLATLDLKAASDTVCIEVCRLLLPKQWFDLLMMLRCETGTLPDGTTVTFEKISSMGNGFTFELESLLFWAISSTVVDTYDCEHLVGVYGDDIVVPTEAAGCVVEVLQFLGFATNTDKSFVSGPFRESCGKHYFQGIDVTPFQIDYQIKTHSDRFLLANSLRRWSARQTDGTICDPRYRKPYDAIVASIPERFRIVIPDDAGDRAGLIGTLSELAASKSRPQSRRNFVRYFAMSPVAMTVDLVCGIGYNRALMLSGTGVVDIASICGLFLTEEGSLPRWDDGQHTRKNGGWSSLALRQRHERRRVETRRTSRWSDACYWPS